MFTTSTTFFEVLWVTSDHDAHCPCWMSKVVLEMWNHCAVLMTLSCILKDVLQKTDHIHHSEARKIVKNLQNSQIILFMIFTWISELFFFQNGWSWLSSTQTLYDQRSVWSLIIMLMNPTWILKVSLLDGGIMILIQLKIDLLFGNQLIMMLMLELYQIWFKIEWSWFSCKFINSESCAFRQTDHDSHATKIQIVLSKPLYFLG